MTENLNLASEVEADRADAGPVPGGESCLLCGGELRVIVSDIRDSRFGLDAPYNIAACCDCQLEHLSPRPSPQELQELYEARYNFRGLPMARYSGWRQRFYNSAAYRLWCWLDGDISFHFRKGRGRLLDIGCNEGRGLKFYRQSGFLAEGLELNREAAAQARAMGFDVTVLPLAEFAPPQPYATAVLSNVLEHAWDPGTMLKQAHRVLQPGGELWVSCPNRNSLLRRCFGKQWINWHIPFHIVHFSSDNLRAILARHGFEVVSLRQETPALWVAGSVLGWCFARPGQLTRQLRSPLWVALGAAVARFLLFPIWWLANRYDRGDCLIAVARRTDAAATSTPGVG